MDVLSIELAITTLDDLNSLYVFQIDQQANLMAAFTSKDYADKEAYITKYSKFLSDPDILMCTIRLKGLVIGSISKYVMFEENEITYWIDKDYWGKGIASLALNEFLKMESARPIFGRTAFDNLASQKVLMNNGFVKIGVDKGFANARGMEIEEFIFKLV
jgi:RimJ/RimL family protein N-acetyltransferase